MPSERFLKLAGEKRQRIREAAVAEFSRVSFEEVSINRIIKDADISRGSFYTYFEDKLDLLQYLMADMGSRFLETLIGFLDEEKGDFFRMAERFFEGILIWSETAPEFQMIRNALPNMEMVSMVMKKDDTDSTVYHSRRFRAMCDALYKHSSHELISVSREDFPEFAELVLTITIRDAMHGCCDPGKQKELRRALKLQLRMIRDGVGRKETTDTEETRNETKRKQK